MGPGLHEREIVGRTNVMHGNEKLKSMHGRSQIRKTYWSVRDT